MLKKGEKKSDEALDRSEKALDRSKKEAAASVFVSDSVSARKTLPIGEREIGEAAAALKKP